MLDMAHLIAERRKMDMLLLVLWKYLKCLRRIFFSVKWNHLMEYNLTIHWLNVLLSLLICPRYVFSSLGQLQNKKAR